MDIEARNSVHNVMPDKGRIEGETIMTITERLCKAHVTYNYCGICGHVPTTRQDEPNRAPLKWWDPDDGWKIGSLCRWCAEEVLDDQPKPGDYAYRDQDSIDCNTDEDPIEAL